MALLHKVADKVLVHDRYYLVVDMVLALGKSCWEEHKVLVRKVPVYKALVHMVRVHKVQACKVLVVVCNSNLALGIQHGHTDLKQKKTNF